MQRFLTRSEVQDLVANGMNVLASYRNTPSLPMQREEKLGEALIVDYVAAKEWMEAPSLILLGEIVVSFMQKVNMDSLLMRDFETPTQCNKFMVHLH